MFQKHFVKRTLQVSAVGLGLFLVGVPSTGRTEPAAQKQDSCESTFTAAQQKQQAGQLVEASRLYGKCAVTSCDEEMWIECATRETQLHGELASVVPMVTDENGEAQTNVQVRMDGQLLTATINGRSVTVTPGAHEFSFSSGKGVFASEKVTVAKGEHNRLISVSLPSAPISLAD